MCVFTYIHIYVYVYTYVCVIIIHSKKEAVGLKKRKEVSMAHLDDEKTTENVIINSKIK